MSTDDPARHARADPHAPRVRPRRLLRLRRRSRWPRCCTRSSSAPARSNPLAPEAAASSRPRPSGHLPVHGRRAEPPRDVRPQAAAEQARRPAAARRSSARPSTSSSRATPSCSARARTFKKYGQSGIEVSDLFPHIAELRRRHRRDPLVPRRHGRPLGGAVRAVHRPGRARVSRAWARGSLYGLGSESESLPAYVVMPDPNGALEAGQPMYTQRLPAGGLPADDVPPRRPAGAATSTCRRASPPAQRRKTLELIRELNEATLDPDDEEFSARINAYDLAFKMQTEAPEVLDLSQRAAGDARPVRHRQRADRRLRPALPAGRQLVEHGVRFVVRRLRRRARATCSGTPTTTSRRTTCARPPRPTSRSPACSRT